MVAPVLSFPVLTEAIVRDVPGSCEVICDNLDVTVAVNCLEAREIILP